MINTSEIISEIENLAPVETAQSWDNSGWQIFLGKEETKKVMLCLTVTQNVISQALEHGCDLIISHHPVIFNPIKKITNNTVSEKIIIEAIKNDVQIYSAHTNLDIAKGGVNDILCERLGIDVIETRNEGFVKIAKLPELIDLDSFILKLKISLNVSKIKIINPCDKKYIQTIAVCSGSGSSFADELKDVDAFITGDVKYHNALDVQNILLIDAGHFETERIVLQSLKNLLEKITKDIVVAKEKEPWIIV